MPISIKYQDGEKQMKLYTFLDEDGNILEEVRAENHDQAVARLTNKEALRLERELSHGCDFYSSEIDKEEDEEDKEDEC